MCIGQCPMSHVQGHSGGDLASSLRYLKILSLRSTFPPLRSLLWTSSLIYRVAEVERGYGGSPPKSLDLDENFKPEFCRELRFVTINALFGDLWPKKVPFESKTVFLGQEVHYYMVYDVYFTELNLQVCDYAQKQRICRKNCKYALDENFQGHFCP